MKKLLFIALLILAGGTSWAQTKAEIKEMFWGKNDAYKNALSVPDKWKNESAVVLCKIEDYDFHKFGINITYVSSGRKRVKLLDQNAVTEFSEFSFKDRFYSRRGYSWKQATNVMGIKVIKPDGTEREINIDADAVTADDKKKVAIANLEVGDIIDFYYHSTEPFKSVLEYGFAPVETTLGDNYPVVDMKLTLHTENDFFVNFATYNGAPELKEVSEKGKSKRVYQMEAHDIEKDDFPRWFYPLAELPSYKFQVFFARSGKFEERASAFLPEKENLVKKTVSEDDVMNYYVSKFEPMYSMSFLKDFMKQNDFKTNADKVRQVYYYARHMFYTRYVEPAIANEANMLPNAYYYYQDDLLYFNTEKSFINFFMMFLKNEKIDYDIVVATPRENGPIKDLLLESNAMVLLKVDAEEPVYLQFFTPFTNADQVNYSIENSDAYLLKVSKLKKVTAIETVKLPSSTPQDNRSLEKLEVKIDPDFASAKIAKESFYYGHNKDSEQEEKLYFFDYVYEDAYKYGSKTIAGRVTKKKDKERLTKEFDALIAKLKDKQQKQFKESAESELGLKVEDHSCKVVSTGRFGKSEPLSLSENFTIKEDLIKKAGNNYTFDIGKLIGQQVNLEEKELKRKQNVYFSFPRSFEEEITVTIPEGYTVAGLDKLNKNIDNTAGSFISTATLSGNTLTVKTKKQYKNYFEPGSNWNNVVAFVEAAYQFTQEKILLKKQ